MTADVDSMWYCPECRSWVGTEIETCFVCETDRPRIPVTHDRVPVDYAPNVTLKHRLSAKLRWVVPR